MKKLTIKKILEKIDNNLESLRIELMKKESTIQMLEYGLAHSRKVIEDEKLKTVEYMSTYGFADFAINEIKKQDSLKESIKVANKELDAIRDDIREVLSEKKKYDHILHTLLIEENMRALKTENEILDEFQNKKLDELNLR